MFGRFLHLGESGGKVIFFKLSYIFPFSMLSVYPRNFNVGVPGKPSLPFKLLIFSLHFSQFQSSLIIKHTFRYYFKRFLNVGR